MSNLEQDQICYACLEGKKYDAVKAKILKLYVDNLEEAYYPYDKIYPKRQW